MTRPAPALQAGPIRSGYARKQAAAADPDRIAPRALAGGGRLAALPPLSRLMPRAGPGTGGLGMVGHDRHRIPTRTARLCGFGGPLSADPMAALATAMVCALDRGGDGLLVRRRTLSVPVAHHRAQIGIGSRDGRGGTGRTHRSLARNPSPACLCAHRSLSGALSAGAHLDCGHPGLLYGTPVGTRKAGALTQSGQDPCRRLRGLGRRRSLWDFGGLVHGAVARISAAVRRALCPGCIHLGDRRPVRKPCQTQPRPEGLGTSAPRPWRNTRPHRQLDRGRPPVHPGHLVVGQRNDNPK